MNFIERIYARLFEFFGPQLWWPAETIEEIVIGAVLTQNTNWSNVERAIHNLKRENALSLKKILSVSPERLAQMIRPSGYYNIKEKRLRAVAEYFVRRCDGRYASLDEIPLDSLRAELLAIHGVGRETADSILLYAFGRPVFVVDAYTRRFGVRHGVFPETHDYEDVRKVFESSVEKKVPLFNEFHALIVRLGRLYCRPIRRCDSCPLNQKAFFRTPSRQN